MLAISTGYYNTLKFFHVLAAITWVGSAIYAQVLATKVIGEGDPARLAATAKDIGDLGKRLITPAAIAVLVFGVWIVVVSAWNFLGPESERLGKLGAERDPSDPEIQRRIKRIFAVSRVDLVVLILVVADMVFKPGS
jgi:hypothetical protein